MHARKLIDDSALVHVNTGSGSIEKTAKIDNISLDGICLKNIGDIHADSTPENLRGAQAAVYLRSNPVSVFGFVARSEKDGCLAVKIKQSTNDALWEKLST